MKKDSVCLKINRGEILNELTRRTSYTALSVNSVEIGAEALSDRIVLSCDEYEWCNDKFKAIFYKLRDTLLPFASVDSAKFADFDDTYICFKINVAEGLYSSIKHHINEVIINYILSEWYFERLQSKCEYVQLQYENNLSLLRMMLNRSLGVVRRPTTYL